MITPQKFDQVQKVADSDLPSGVVVDVEGQGSLSLSRAATALLATKAGRAALEGCIIREESLVLLETLGAGCFGFVHKGILTSPEGSNMEVAVKRLKGTASRAIIRTKHVSDYLEKLCIFLIIFSGLGSRVCPQITPTPSSCASSLLKSP